MRRTTKITATVAGSALAATTLIATHAGAVDSKATAFNTANGVLRLCEFSDASTDPTLTQVRIFAEGPQYVITGSLPNNGQTCVDTEVPAGQYFVHPEKYAAAPCDSSGVGKGPFGFPGSPKKVCEAKFHHVHITHSLAALPAGFVVAPYGSPVTVVASADLSAEPTIETGDGDEWSPVYVSANRLSKVSYHDTDTSRAECTAAAPTPPGRPLGIVCGD
jgi:hypothetical protein